MVWDGDIFAAHLESPEPGECMPSATWSPSIGRVGRLLCQWSLLLGLSACSGDSPAPEPIAEKTPVVTESGTRIQETTEGELGGVNVGVSNIWERDYTLPDGSSRSGLTATLSFGSGSTVAGKGSRVKIGTGTFEVVEITKASGQNGEVRFEESEAPVEAAPRRPPPKNGLVKFLKKGGVTSLGGKRLGLVSMGPGTYTLPDGSSHEGLVAHIQVIGGDHSIEVGTGSEFELGGERRWRVTQVDETRVSVEEVLQPLLTILVIDGSASMTTSSGDEGSPTDHLARALQAEPLKNLSVPKKSGNRAIYLARFTSSSRAIGRIALIRDRRTLGKMVEQHLSAPLSGHADVYGAVLHAMTEIPKTPAVAAFIAKTGAHVQVIAIGDGFSQLGDDEVCSDNVPRLATTLEAVRAAHADGAGPTLHTIALGMPLPGATRTKICGLHADASLTTLAEQWVDAASLSVLAKAGGGRTLLAPQGKNLPQLLTRLAPGP